MPDLQRYKRVDRNFRCTQRLFLGWGGNSRKKMRQYSFKYEDLTWMSFLKLLENGTSSNLSKR